ncbi:3'(2'),5'-bisphosphate nucleotidase CysQ [Marinimicrobium alkaliphilum]|uniref:3'(2'),5'-bisphosphate nucleotidase CysQ n=1 Tax=Marinimicrobium alkaliphilum TaxID=2202654 RepID=UPI000DBAB395|nr:3'(2'),5'-bisphosphate nucleotidase CysQ [Marinimicrobium alkaliphilum]
MIDSTLPYAQIIRLAEEAGQAIMTVYRDGFNITQKADDSPVTEADMAAHHCIEAGLRALTPGIPQLSEESAHVPWDERRQWQRYWLIDPLDGTKEFIKRNDEFTVNIALIDGAEAIWGVVHAPALGLTFAGGPAEQGAYRVHAQGENDTLSVEGLPGGREGWHVMGSRAHHSTAFKEFVEQFNEPDITNMGSSLKICHIAEGKAHVYPRLGPTSEWDTAAGHAILRSAGGEIINAHTGEPLTYNQKPSLLNPAFLALGGTASPDDYAELLSPHRA